jgi:hypothetical protein
MKLCFDGVSPSKNWVGLVLGTWHMPLFVLKRGASPRPTQVSNNVISSVDPYVGSSSLQLRFFRACSYSGVFFLNTQWCIHLRVCTWQEQVLQCKISFVMIRVRACYH